MTDLITLADYMSLMLRSPEPTFSEYSPLLETHPCAKDLLRFEDDGGRVPDPDPIPVFVTVRTKLPWKTSLWRIQFYA